MVVVVYIDVMLLNVMIVMKVDIYERRYSNICGSCERSDCHGEGAVVIVIAGYVGKWSSNGCRFG